MKLVHSPEFLGGELSVPSDFCSFVPFCGQLTFELLLTLLMNFVSFGFAIFFCVVLASWWATQKIPGLRPGLLLVFNLFFYASAGLTFVPLLLGVSILNWGAVRLLAGAHTPGQRKAWFVLGIAANLSLLAFFKYYEFLLLGLADMLALAGIHLPLNVLMPPFLVDMVFPIGISFYIFQGIAYLAEQYKSSEPQPQSYGRVLLFLSFFPTVLAGPILRPGQFFPQLDAVSGGTLKCGAVSGEALKADAACGSTQQADTSTDRNAMQEGFALMLSGLFKKVVLASYLSEHVVRDAFQGPEGFSSWGILIAVYGYSMQIYCDFSGYTDLALGVARLMGFRLPQNFASPYLARNLQDFWRRWHITLSSWLRDYLYIPLGGSRRGSRYGNLLITMLLGGLWHGAHTRFIVWGAMHGVGLGVVHAVQQLTKRHAGTGETGKDGATPAVQSPSWFGTGLSWFLTFNFVTLAWVFFGAEDMDRALEILRRLVFWGQSGNGFPLMALPAIACTFAVQLGGARLMRGFVAMQQRLPLVVQGAVLAVLCCLILRMGPDGVLPFIYFQF